MNIESQILLRGAVKVDVVDHAGNTVHEGHWQPNLLLNQGLDNLAEVYMCELFAYAVKGNDTVPMKEAVTGNYSFDGSTGELTRKTGPRLWSSDDEGKVLRSANKQEAQIQLVVSTASGDNTMVAYCAPVGSVNPMVSFTNQAISLYNASLTGLASEDGRTNTYSTTPGDNSTTFPRNYLNQQIPNGKLFKRTFLFTPEAANVETVTDTYTWSVSTVTRSSGTRNFTAADIGSYVQFDSTSGYAKITAVAGGGASCTVDRHPSAPITSPSTIHIHGHRTYSHIGFSNVSTPGDNLNILVRLETGLGVPSPVSALGVTPETAGQQIKVSYQFQVIFGPSGITSFTAAFSDPQSVLGNTAKTGQWVLENIASSSILSDGSTDITSTALEPCAGGTVALSPISAPLVLVSTTTPAPDRNSGVAVSPMTPDAYIPGSYTRTVTGSFGPNEANAINWRSMGIYDDATRRFLFTMLWNAVFKKPNTHQMTLHFRKTWNRDLS